MSEEKKNIEVNDGMTVYDLNKQLKQEQPALDIISLNVKITNLKKDIDEMRQKTTNILYMMLLCNERHDYTVFEFVSIVDLKSTFVKDFLETITNRGDVIEFDKRENEDVWEIWVRDPQTKELYVYHLFDYTQGILCY